MLGYPIVKNEKYDTILLRGTNIMKEQTINSLLEVLYAQKAEAEAGKEPTAIIFVQDSLEERSLTSFGYGRGGDVVDTVSSGINRQLPQEAIDALMTTIKERLENK